MSDKFAVLRECTDQFEAETIRIRLASDRIPVLITGTDPNVALSLGGAATARPVRVEVDRSDLDRADALLKMDSLRARQSDFWICSRCHEQNEPTFDVCWSCNKVRRETTSSEQTQEGQESTEESSRTRIKERLHRPLLQSDTTSENIEGSPVHATPSKVAPEGNQETGWESVSRCARAAVVGLLLLPSLFSFYSIYLLLQLDPAVYHAPKTKRRVWGVWILNAVVISLGSTLWWMLIFRQ
jgi:hypothetical protein